MGQFIVFLISKGQPAAQGGQAPTPGQACSRALKLISDFGLEFSRNDVDQFCNV
jgi:hypothetical protein